MLKTVSGGLSQPLGTMSWGISAWARYVLMGNYDENGQGVFQQISDQRIGVFDTERKRFCSLDIAPTLENAGIEFMAVAHPDQRRTRIF